MRAHITGILFVAAIAGCYASTGVGYHAAYVGPAPVYTAPTATVTVDTYGPDLVDVGGGVQVIADYEEPVFYTDNFYWRFYGGTWYRSNVHTGGWVVYNDVPYSVRRIDRPHAYVRYRPNGYVPRSQRGYREDRPVVRDHREPYRDNRPYQPTVREQPTVRDHRQPYQPVQQPVVRDQRQPYQPVQQPVTRDHRDAAPAPVVRDQRQPYQPVQQPVTRDHRDAAPAPVTRDHRDQRDRRDRDARPAPVTRDHR